MEVQCPQCGNPNLDVDEANSVVFCKKCGFAVKVDPQTGNVTPLTEGGPAAGGGGGGFAPPEAYGGRTIFGTDPLTFFLGATALLMLLTLIGQMGWSWFIVFESIVLIFWWYNR
ncbi:MAG: hypothetical protein V1835_06895 [Candidatus Micrarchaeota archaeon]